MAAVTTRRKEIASSAKAPVRSDRLADNVRTYRGPGAGAKSRAKSLYDPDSQAYTAAKLFRGGVSN